ncbi:amino acid ABC transporter ATPase [Kiloniella spongiae]|uniref:Amino acid ABC transporter ATPase n=1 Tax=Kiloniella spongiae TaxID=1489064 RepID=A0A0H2MAM3_9PROT|nr:ABC transporter ATP-binding protein [Kiloniella spongiae]KLN59564.1 amino acid ABC transporter ATPase [Kiloniella spongiae]
MLQLKNVDCGYGVFQAVHNLSFSVEQGQIFALLGPNGAGKSSTIMSIAGHVKLFAGSLHFDGQDISSLLARERVRKGIAVAPEGRRLFPDLTIEENLTVGGYSQSKVKEAVNRDMVFSLFPRLTERLRQPAGTLSGGEQQMLAIGRAMMAEPRLLMIDEVSLGLMPKMVDVCYNAIRHLKSQGVTILLVEQNTKRALDVADQVCVLESGNAVWQGSADEAKKDPDLIEAFLGMTKESAA